MGMQDEDNVAVEDEEISPDRLRLLLKDIIYYFSADKEAMRKLHDTLLKLID